MTPARRKGRVRRIAGWLAVGFLVIGLPGVTGCMEHLFYYPDRGETTPPAYPPWLQAAESVWFPSADGTKLHGWLIPACDGTPPSEAATILHVHGNAGNIESHVWFTEYLPPAGFNVLVFDFRGYGRSEGRATRRGPLMADTEAALDALLARADIDAGRLGLYGQSLGGGLGLNVMAGRPELRAAVIESSFTSWREMAAAAVGGDPPSVIGRLLARLFIRDSARPDRAVARIDRPILILHGTGDSIVPISHGRRLAAAGGSVRLVELPGGDHNTLRDTHPEIEPLVIDFFREHLAAGSPGRSTTADRTSP